MELTGLVLPLLGPGLRLVTREGAVGRLPAEVALDLASPLTTVSSGCFPSDALPESPGTVRVPRPEGGFSEVPGILLPDARVGAAQIGPRRAGLVARPVCALTLGSDVLARYALAVDPVRREVTLLAPRPRAEYLREVAEAPASEERYALELSRDPLGDWLLLFAQARQGDARLAGPFVLATAQSRSLVSDAAARAGGFASEAEELKALGIPLQHVGPPGYALDALELAPGLSFARARLVGRPASGGTPVGALGGDVWGRFHAVIDPGAGLLLLRRPKVSASRSAQRCAEANGDVSEEACFALRADPAPGGFHAAATLWRDLPEGGRLYLQPLDAQGRPLSTGCQVGFTFEPSDRGASAERTLPWAALEKTLPPCARALREAKGAALGLFEEGALPECPGNCAFATHLLSRRTRCDCPLPGPSSLTDAERRLLQRVRERTGPRRPAPADAEPEPEP